METLILSIIFAAAYIVAYKPQYQKQADRLLYLSILLSVFTFIAVTWQHILPFGNI